MELPRGGCGPHDGVAHRFEFEYETRSVVQQTDPAPVSPMPARSAGGGGVEVETITSLQQLGGATMDRQLRFEFTDALAGGDQLSLLRGAQPRLETAVDTGLPPATSRPTAH